VDLLNKRRRPTTSCCVTVFYGLVAQLVVQRVVRRNKSKLVEFVCITTTRHTCGAVGEVAEPDVSVTLKMKHLTAVIASDDRQVAVSRSPRVTDHREISAAHRYIRTEAHTRVFV